MLLFNAADIYENKNKEQEIPILIFMSNKQNNLDCMFPGLMEYDMEINSLEFLRQTNGCLFSQNS